MDELDRIEAELKELNARRKILMEARTNLLNKMGVRNTPAIDILVEFIEENPGANRQVLSSLFAGMTDSDLTNLLVKAGRNRGLIENRGTRKHPAWYAVD